MTQQIEKMDLADFEKLPGASGQGQRSWQATAMEHMTPSNAIIMDHKGLFCGKILGTGGCTVSGIATRLHKTHPDRRWFTRHLKDGRVAVACYHAAEG